jgi:hypothetical protein
MEAVRRLSTAMIGRKGMLAWALALASLLVASSGPSSEHVADETKLDLRGGWYVLVHFRDLESSEPEAVHWQDRIWRFEIRGSRLVWTEHPRVRFDDMSGRIELLEGGREARTLGGWEPGPRQLHEIRAGLAIDAHAARSKSLRGSFERGYRSVGSLHSESASVIGYHESWRIDDPLRLPRFTRDDSMGSGRTEGLTGHTEYMTRKVLAGGDELRGDFQRDGTLRGSFRMLRMGDRGRTQADEALPTGGKER